MDRYDFWKYSNPFYWVWFLLDAMSKTIEQDSEMKDALIDIMNWNDDLSDEYDDPGIRARIGLGLIK